MTTPYGKPVCGLAMCFPSTKSLACGICARYRPGYEGFADTRRFIVIDASIIKAGTACPMYAAREPVRHFYDLEAV